MSSELTDQLVNACGEGDLEKVKSLIEQGADINARDCGKCLPLSEACWHRRVNVVKYLVEQGADLKLKSHNITILQTACQRGSIEIVNILVSKNAELDTKDENAIGFLLGEVFFMGYLDVFCFLETQIDMSYYIRNDEFQLLYWACEGRQLKIVKYLVSEGANVNTKNSLGWTPLKAAFESGYLEIVEFLKLHGADVK